MPRVPYLPADLGEPPELVAAIRARRGGTLLEPDRLLLHSPPLARGWNALLGAIRGELTVEARLRQLAICTVAALTGASYALHHHAPLFLAAGGSEEQLTALRRGASILVDTDVFAEDERAVMRLAVELTRDGSVRDSTFAPVLELLGERGTVELVAIVAAYNMVSRFLVGLGIEPE
jgi:alkylhydroperoxidase family enzyme